MKYVPTIHSKVRYSQRDNPRDTMDETVLLAKKYGVRIEDIPLEHNGIRGFLGHNKIYYEGRIYIFTEDSNYTKLVTIYYNKSSILEKIFVEKEKIRKNEILMGEKKHYKIKITKFKNEYYKIVYFKDKIIEYRLLLNCPEGIFYKSDKINIEINKYLMGKRVYLRKYIELKDISPMDKIIYNEVLNIPYGKTISYKELVNKLSIKISIRALVLSLNRCPLLYFIPTHRVICSNGKIGSFCTRTSLKEELIKMEKHHAINNEKQENNKTEENDFCVSIGELFIKNIVNK